MKKDKNKEQMTEEYSAFIKQLAKIAKETDLSEIHFSYDLKEERIDVKISRNKEMNVISGSSPNFLPQQMFPQNFLTTSPPINQATVTDSIPEDLAKHPGAIVSPMVGVVYTSSNPTSPAFVEIGSIVKEGDTVLLMEAMKVFNPIKSPKAGKVTKILVKSNQAVEYGEVLLIVE